MLVEQRPLVAAALRPDGTVEPAFDIVIEQREGGEVVLTATCTSVGPVDAGLRVELRLESTSDPKWLVPGIFYGENRPEQCARLFPRFVAGRTDVEAMESDAWSFRADRCATPAVFALGGGLVTTEESALGQSGVGFAYRDGRPVIWLDFPYREEPLRYDGSETAAPPDVQTYRWQPGERAVLKLRQNDGDWRGALRPDTSLPESPAWVSVEEAAGLAAWGLYRWHYRPDPARLIETAAFDRGFAQFGDRDAMHVSWVSGVPYAYALLLHGRRVGNTDYVQAAEAVLDHVAANLTPGGTFWSQWTAERGWTTGWHPDRSRLHARTLADATLFMLRAGGRWEAAAARTSRSRAGRSAKTAPSRRHITSTRVTQSRGKAPRASPGSRHWSRRASWKRLAPPASTTDGSSTPSFSSARPRTSTSRRRPRTAMRPSWRTSPWRTGRRRNGPPTGC